MDWPTIIEEKKYCVLKLEAHNNSGINPLKPYTSASTSISHGSGYIIDIENGLVLTASSLVLNNIVIRGTNDIDPSRTIRMTLFCINVDLGFAICQMREEDKEYLQRRVDEPEKLNVIACCSLNQQVGQQVLILGYSKNIIQAQISKWLTHQDTYRRLNLAPELNFVGSPVFDPNGNCLGVVVKRNAMYCCLLMHTILNIYSLVTEVGIVNQFQLGISWSRTSSDFNSRYTAASSVASSQMSTKNTTPHEISGVHIDKLYPGTFLTDLNPEDILMSITYNDCRLDKIGKITDLMLYDTKTELDENNQQREIIAIIDNMGEIDLYHKQGDDIGERVINHKIDLIDIIKMCPYGTSISIIVCRAGNLRKIVSTVARYEFFHIERSLLQYQPQQFEIVAGMCLSVLNLNHVDVLDCAHLHHFTHGDNQYVPHIIITHVYVCSTLYDVDVFAPGDIIVRVNGRSINTIDQLQQLLSMQPTAIEFVNHKDKRYYISRERAVEEDRTIISKENIRGYHYRW